MKRDQTLHERLIPLLVEGIGAKKYLEFGTYDNATISKVVCDMRIGVDPNGKDLDGVVMCQMTAEQFCMENAAKLAPFDVVFIDSEHSAEAVRRQFIAIWPYVAEDGLILVHDTNPEHESDAQPGFCGDAWKFAFTAAGSVEAMTLPQHPGLTLIRKRSRWGPKP